MTGHHNLAASHFLTAGEVMRSAAASILIMMTGVVTALVFVGSQSKPAATRVFLPEATTAVLGDGQQATPATAR
jgi:hypothetical protein